MELGIVDENTKIPSSLAHKINEAKGIFLQWFSKFILLDYLEYKINRLMSHTSPRRPKSMGKSPKKKKSFYLDEPEETINAKNELFFESEDR